jgi:hemerythrin-like domain-containing protein
MRAIQTLCEEHRALRDVLDALELILDCQRDDDHLEAAFALDALEWLERFADGLHQDREERGLIPRLEQRAPERAESVLSGLMRWHAHERERLEGMRAQIEGAAYGDAWSRDSFTAAARAYIEIQRQHMDFEDAQLLPFASEVLTPEDDGIILAEYERLELRYLRAGEPTTAERAERLIACAAQRALECQPSLVPRPATGSRGRPVGTLEPASAARAAASPRRPCDSSSRRSG